VPRTCADGKSFTSAASPTTMTRSAMNPGFFRARDGFHEFDTVLHAKLQNLILDTPKYAVMLADESKKKRDASAGDGVRVALVDLTGDKICKPGYADWGSTFPITGGSTVKIAMLYAAHQLLFDLNEMARTGGLKTAADLKKKAVEVWSELICPPDLDWLVKFDSIVPTVRAKGSQNLDLHLKQMVIAAFSDSSVGRANQLIMRLGFEYIASVLWQSGLRHSRRQGLWVRNTYQQAKILATADPRCNYKTRYKTPDGERERILWYQDPTDDTEFSLTALSVVTFFTLLAQPVRRWQFICGKYAGLLLVLAPGEEVAPEALMAKLNPELMRGSLDLMVLSVLTGGRKYGYRLQQEMRDASRGMVDVQAGTLYPLLHRLEGDKLIRSKWDESTGRRRKWYELTETGRKRLSQQAREWHEYAECLREMLSPVLGSAPETA
jgi:DNA-binding PadR family transcriptional regulator